MDTRSKLLAAMAFASLATLPASAQTAPPVNKTWVSSTGNDTGSCQLAAPCRTFAYAIGVTNADGEIDVKDSGSYGAVSITKSINIVADGVVATVGAANQAAGAIYIDATDNGAVVLHGLTIDTHAESTTSTQSGVFISASPKKGVTIDHCIFQENNIAIYDNSNGFMMVSNNFITGNGVGIANHGGANIYLSGNVITTNFEGLINAFNSYGNNSINGNTSCDACGATVNKVTLE